MIKLYTHIFKSNNDKLKFVEIFIEVKHSTRKTWKFLIRMGIFKINVSSSYIGLIKLYMYIN